MDSDGGKEAQVTTGGGLQPIESTDGERLFYLTSDSTYSSSELWTVPVKGGEETKILDAVWGRDFDVRRDGIYFILFPGAHGGPSLQFFSFASKTSKEIAKIDRRVENGFTVSPDGRFAVYPQSYQSNADLMLVDNFR